MTDDGKSCDKAASASRSMVNCTVREQTSNPSFVPSHTTRACVCSCVVKVSLAAPRAFVGGVRFFRPDFLTFTGGSPI